MYMVGFLTYVLVCGALAWWLAKLIARRAKAPWVRSSVAGVLMPVVLLLPLADEIVGYFQLERQCKEAKEVKIHGTIPVGEELYTPDGKWRLRIPGEDAFRLQEVVGRYLRQEYRRLPDVRGAIEIRGGERKIYDARSGRLLAEYRSYSSSGGWVSRSVEGTIIVSACLPKAADDIQQTLLKFTKSSETTK